MAIPLSAAAAAAATTVAEKMKIHLPLHVGYATRGEATEALHLALLRSAGSDCKIDSGRSGKDRVTLRCPSSMKPVKGARAKWRALDLGDFACPQKEGEGYIAHRNRRMVELEEFAESQGHCGFKAVLVRGGSCDGGGAGGGGGSCGDSEPTWYFKIMDSGLNFKMHSDDCIVVGKATGRVARCLVKASAKADPSLSCASAIINITGDDSQMSIAMMPSKASMYRAMNKIKWEGEAFYEENWARLEVYLRDLRKLNNNVHVVLEKDEDNHFER